MNNDFVNNESEMSSHLTQECTLKNALTNKFDNGDQPTKYR